MNRALLRLGSPDGEVVRVTEGGRVVAEVRARGAQVTRWRPDGAAEDVVFVGVQHHEPDQRVVHGGVPVCFPWFGTGPGGDLRPSHGPARLVAWEELASDLLEGDLVTRWSLGPAQVRGAEGAQHVPPGVVAVLVTVLGPDSMEVSLEVSSTGAEQVTVEAALHTYLRVGDVARVRLEGLDGASFLDKVLTAEQGAPVHRVQEGDLRIEGEVDRVYASSGTVLVHDPVLGRTIEVAKEGSRSTVVWNPAQEKGSAFADLAAGEWREYVCVEAASTGDTAVTVEPGGTHTMSQRITLR